MTENGKKPGAEGQPDPLSATGMFLNAFRTQPDQAAEPEERDKWFAPEDKGGAKLGGPWGQPLNSPSVPPAPVRPPLGEGKPVPGEFTQMFQKLDFFPAPPVSPSPEPRPSTEMPREEPGEFTRMFVRATASMPQRPMPPLSDPAALAAPAVPKLKGFSTPGVSDSASAEGSFTQLFQTPAPAPRSPNPDPTPGKAAMEAAGVTQLFRALTPENQPQANGFGEQSPQPAARLASSPESVTMLIQRLTEDLESSAPSTSLPAIGAEPAALSEPGEFTRIMSGGSVKAAVDPGSAAPKPASPAPVLFAVPAAPLPPAPAIAAPAIPAPPKLQAPPIPAPPAAPGANPPQSKLQQMMPMLLVLNAFLLVVLIVLVVFLLKTR
jgi:hypothetical protein